MAIVALPKRGFIDSSPEDRQLRRDLPGQDGTPCCLASSF